MDAQSLCTKLNKVSGKCQISISKLKSSLAPPQLCKHRKPKIIMLIKVSKDMRPFSQAKRMSLKQIIKIEDINQIRKSSRQTIRLFLPTTMTNITQESKTASHFNSSAWILLRRGASCMISSLVIQRFKL